MDATVRLVLLKADLQRTGASGVGDGYLGFLLRAAEGRLKRQGIRDDSSEDYNQVLISTAAWLYRKRVNGEVEPEHLRRMRLDLIVSNRAGGAAQ